MANNGVKKSTRESFVSVLEALRDAKIPFLVGGDFAIYHFTAYMRNTSDIDLFLHRRDVGRALAKLVEAGFSTNFESSHWLAKARRNGDTANLIFGFGNWVSPLDKTFFSRSHDGKVLGVPVKLASPEDIIWFESYFAARERFDGSDINHLISVLKGNLDWTYLVSRFGEKYWQLLLADVLLFHFTYPSERGYVPSWLMEDLLARVRALIDKPPPRERLCWGILLDRFSFVADIEDKGYKDPREELAKEQGNSSQKVVEDRARAREVLEASLK